MSPGGRSDAAPIGRERELELLAAVDGTAGPLFVIVSGDPGIGKTTVWRAEVERRRAAGHTVLTARPAPEDRHGPATGLHDLFGAVEGTAAPQAAGLDPASRSRVVVDRLRRLAADAPVVVAIDDLQWLDDVTANALRSAYRRLTTEPVLLLATLRREPGGGAPPLPPGADELVLDPLDQRAIAKIVRRTVGPLSPPEQARIAQLAGGNPLFAIELALRPPTGMGAPATSLRSAVAARVDALPASTLAMVRTAAAAGPATADRLERGSGLASAGAALDDAIALGLLVLREDGLLRVAHPVIASVVLDDWNPIERMHLHARLAEVVADPDARAWHLALSSTEPDEAVATELEATADRAARRGALAGAADLSDHAVRLTPRGEVAARTRRTLAAITRRAAAGEPERASAAAAELLAALPAGDPARLEAITLQVFLDVDHGEHALADALEEAGEDRWWRGRLLELLGWLLATYRGRLTDGAAAGGSALALALEEGDTELEMVAAATLSTTRLLAGRPDPALIDRAVALESDHEPPRLGRWPRLFLARQCLWRGDLDRARELFESMRAAFSELGVEFQRPYRLSDLATVEVASGALSRAAELLDDALDAADDAGNRQATVWHDYPAGLTALHQGRHEAAGRHGQSLVAWGDVHDQPSRRLMGHHVLGLDALARGDAAAAVGHLSAGVELARTLGLRHPGFVAVLPDAVEANALAGDVAVCVALADELDAQSRTLDAPWPRAAALRARGLARLVEGSSAAGILAEAAAAFESTGHRLDAERTRLLEGRAYRRAGQRGAAAEVLAAAEHGLEAIGAEPWRRQAADERARLIRRREGELTVTEQRVADLAAAGRRNREIAGELYVSVATVEAHLTRIYRKLGVRSRTQLAQVLGRFPARDDDGANLRA